VDCSMSTFLLVHSHLAMLTIGLLVGELFRFACTSVVVVLLLRRPIEHCASGVEAGSMRVTGG
jgi:hypothetical protein